MSSLKLRSCSWSLFNSMFLESCSILKRSALSTASLSCLDKVANSSAFDSSCDLCLARRLEMTRSCLSCRSYESCRSDYSSWAILVKCCCSLSMTRSRSKLASSIRFLDSRASYETYFSFSSYKDSFCSWSSSKDTRWSFSLVLVSSSCAQYRNESLQSLKFLSRFWYNCLSSFSRRPI